MSRAVFLFALLAVVTAESPVRFRPRAAFGVQRPNARFARLEEQPQEQPAEPSAGYQYPKPMSSGYQYPKPDQPFPLPGEQPATEASQPEASTAAPAEEHQSTTEAEPATTTAAFEDYDESTQAAEEAPSNAKLRRRPQQLQAGPPPIRLTQGPAKYRQQQLQQIQKLHRLQQLQQLQQQQYLLNQRLEQPTLAQASTVDQQLRPVYLINLPDSTLQQLVLLNAAQQQQQQQQQLELIPQPTPVYLSELDYIYQKK